MNCFHLRISIVSSRSKDKRNKSYFLLQGELREIFYSKNTKEFKEHLTGMYWIMILRDFKRLFNYEKVLWYSIKTLCNLKKVLWYSIKTLCHFKKVLRYSIKIFHHLKKVSWYSKSFKFQRIV